jgi:hypothetical protein
MIQIDQHCTPTQAHNRQLQRAEIPTPIISRPGYLKFSPGSERAQWFDR